MRKRDEREDKEKPERLTAYVRPPLAHAVRIRCAMDRMTLSQAIEEAMEEWLKKRGDTSPQ